MVELALFPPWPRRASFQEGRRRIAEDLLRHKIFVHLRPPTIDLNLKPPPPTTTEPPHEAAMEARGSVPMWLANPKPTPQPPPTTTATVKHRSVVYLVLLPKRPPPRHPPPSPKPKRMPIPPSYPKLEHSPIPPSHPPPNHSPTPHSNPPPKHSPTPPSDPPPELVHPVPKKRMKIDDRTNTRDYWSFEGDLDSSDMVDSHVGDK